MSSRVRPSKVKWGQARSSAGVRLGQVRSSRVKSAVGVAWKSWVVTQRHQFPPTPHPWLLSLTHSLTPLFLCFPPPFLPSPYFPYSFLPLTLTPLHSPPPVSLTHLSPFMSEGVLYKGEKWMILMVNGSEDMGEWWWGTKLVNVRFQCWWNGWVWSVSE